jgi:hypothetical protein
MNIGSPFNSDQSIDDYFKKYFIVLLPLVCMSTMGLTDTVFATSGDDVSCYDRGIIDGEDHPFNQGTYDRCGDEYYQGFIQGCMSVEGNDRDICESATDG